MEHEFLSRARQLLMEQGACAVGFVKAAPVESGEWRLFEEWLARGWQAGMTYMERWADIRRDPRLLLDGAKTIISAAFNYRRQNPTPEVATYALGRDYHKVLRKRLKAVVMKLREDYGGDYRICIDSAPILERYWAVKAGIGYRSGLHGNVVVPGVGSMVFLAEILTTCDLEFSPATVLQAPDVPSSTKPSPCPTGALHTGGVIDSRLCINYLTIEHKGEWSEEQKSIMELPGAREREYGCDYCQLACAANAGPYPAILPEFEITVEGKKRRGDRQRR